MEDIIAFQGKDRYLSNFWPLEHPVNFEGMDFFTTEAAYVAAKTTDAEERKKIQQMRAGQAKARGAEIVEQKISLNPRWSNDYRVELMYDLVLQKFSNNPELKEKLLKTGECCLVEGNHWHDNFFGICTCDDCSLNRSQINPLNHLGTILMKVREVLKNQG